MGGDGRYSVYAGRDVRALLSPLCSRGSCGGGVISHSTTWVKGKGKKNNLDAFMFRPHRCLWPESQASIDAIRQSGSLHV